MVDLGKCTSYKAGGLLFDKPDLTLAAPVDPYAGEPPLYLDHRSILLPPDDQGQDPYCAAYTMASVIEVALWKKTRLRKTIDPVPIYIEAKRIDGNTDPGTYLDSVFKAAVNLKLIAPTAAMRALRTRKDVMFAIREHEVCLLGFNITEGWNKGDKRTGFIGAGDQKLGGHAVTGCWYNGISGSHDTGVGWGNSWSQSWGIGGFGRMSWEQFDRQFMYGLVVENI
jgi:hypothetical protein